MHLIKLVLFEKKGMNFINWQRPIEDFHIIGGGNIILAYITTIWFFNWQLTTLFVVISLLYSCYIGVFQKTVFSSEQEEEAALVFFETQSQNTKVLFLSFLCFFQEEEEEQEEPQEKRLTTNSSTLKNISVEELVEESELFSSKTQRCCSRSFLKNPKNCCFLLFI